MKKTKIFVTATAAIACSIALATAVAFAQIGRSPMMLATTPAGGSTPGAVPTDISPLSASIPDTTGSNQTIVNLSVIMSTPDPFVGTLQVTGDASGIACGTPPCTLVGTTLITARALTGSDDGNHTIVLAATQNATISRNFTLTVTAVGAGPVVPAPAQAAGFTRLYLDMDFANNSFYDVQDNWLDCTANGNRQWNMGTAEFAPYNECDVHRAQDPTYGNMAMRFRWNPSYFDQTPAFAHGSYVTTQSYHQHTWQINFPFAVYYEFTARWDILVDKQDMTMWSGHSYGRPDGIEYDIIELFGACCVHAGPFGSTFAYTIENPPLPWDPRDYHTYGLLVTSNGSEIQVCAYRDAGQALTATRTQVSTVPGWPTTSNGCVRPAAKDPTDLTNQGRNWIIMGNGTCCGEGQANNPQTQNDVYMTKVRIWTCPNGDTTACIDHLSP